MIAAGLDLGGTKIEAQVFADDWSIAATRRVDTPTDYAALIASIIGLIDWIEEVAGRSGDGPLPVGIGAAGVIDPHTGLALTANLCASGRPLPADIDREAGRAITFINDARAFTLSEAIFGAGRGHRSVLALILGTGVGGGIAIDGALRDGATGAGGEFGHCSAPAALVTAHALPVVRCGCGRMGCVETYLSGAGMARLGRALTGSTLTPREIAARATDASRRVHDVWCAMVADLLRNLVLTADPDVVVLGGGLSQIAGLVADLTESARAAQLGGLAMPPIVLAQGGATSGARGAAYAAWRGARDGR